VPKNLDSPVELFFLGLIIVCVIIGAIAASSAEDSLNDPSDKNRVYLEQLPRLSLLTGLGTFQVKLVRQSGYLHAEYVAHSASAALAQAMSTFRRAKIDAIRISRNSPDELHFNRLFYSHRGSSEGKKVCSAEITRIA
jgi:hypothetical protein